MSAGINGADGVGDDRRPTSTNSNQPFNRQSVIGNLNNWINDLSSGVLFQGLNFLNFRRRGSRGSASGVSTMSPFLARSNSYTSTAASECKEDAASSEEEDNNFSGKTSAKFLNGTLIPTLKTKEIIELDNFGIVEVDNCESGVGHKFEPHELKAPTWCDSCSQFLWTPIVYDSKNTSIRIVSPFSKTIQCVNCKYTCHIRCRRLVRIDCKGVNESIASTGPQDSEDKSKETTATVDSKEAEEQSKPVPQEDVSKETSEKADTEEEKVESTRKEEESVELQSKIEEYNERLKKRGSGLGLTMLSDGKSFRGFLRVHLNLTRPINVVAGTRPPSIYDIINEEEAPPRRTLTSFYMPRNTVKNIHITSEYTSLDVIKAMLKKFKVVDNPQKFALYRRYPDETGESTLKRIGDNEYPLRIALDWCDWDERQFVLQENDTGDIAWDAFLIPELNNFLIMLDREEQEHLDQLRLKYDCLRYELNRYIQVKAIEEEGVIV